MFEFIIFAGIALMVLGVLIADNRSAYEASYREIFGNIIHSLWVRSGLLILVVGVILEVLMHS